MLLEQTLEDLEDEGVELLCAENGVEALAIIRAEQPDLVFLDVMMPQKNGFDVCREVKQQLGMTEVHIVRLFGPGLCQRRRTSGRYDPAGHRF